MLTMSSRGSSPRVRGTAQAGVAPHGDRRFIPACAGNGLASISLIANTFCRGKIPTGIPCVCKGHGNSLLTGLDSSGAEKLTSFIPSKSWGIRRFVPTVSKSNP